MLDHDQMDAFQRDRILTTWAEVAGKARHHLPGGQILPEDRPGLYKRVARISGATVEAVRAAVEGAHAER